VSSCCGPEAYARFFGARGARRALRRYRRRGLDRLGRRIVEVLGGRVEGAVVVEGGGGIGDVQVELLAAGAKRAVNVELSPEYEAAAGELLRERGLEARVERRLGDFAADDAAGDVVVLNRVVCCYPDYRSLLGRAAARARRTLVLTFPVERRLTRWGVALANAWLRLTRADAVPAYVHPVEEMLDVVRAAGLIPFAERRGRVWQLVALERPG
jgi:hypothetical protein